MAPSRIAFDIDGVFADTMTLFLQIAENDFGLYGLQYEHITDYDVKGLPGMTQVLVGEIVERILDGSHRFDLKALDGATRVLKRINRRHRPTLFVTARPNADQIFGWILDRLSLEAENIEVVATGSFEDKIDVLLEHEIGYFVEDRLETCFLLEKVGIRPIVFAQPWNRKPHPFIEVKNWHELEDLIEFE